jgi:hypothetical protein
MQRRTRLCLTFELFARASAAPISGPVSLADDFGRPTDRIDGGRRRHRDRAARAIIHQLSS